MNPTKPPPTRLGRYRQLSPRAAIHVSPLALGIMTMRTNELFLGNNTKSMKLSLEASLKKLRTTYEISDSSVRFVAKANEYAKLVIGTGRVTRGGSRVRKPVYPALGSMKALFQATNPLAASKWSRVPVRPRVNQRVTTRATGRVQGRVRVRVAVKSPTSDPCRSLGPKPRIQWSGAKLNGKLSLCADMNTVRKRNYRWGYSSSRRVKREFLAPQSAEQDRHKKLTQRRQAKLLVDARRRQGRHL
ncbi:hypothetical protein K438DRAFT_1764903 [Mycena galopus ATCC 62051]|nr:hypothetical protein K438DRAFT_1764903 [Mycena galopus ATCC 62051]